jgi:hypothetical protein
MAFSMTNLTLENLTPVLATQFAQMPGLPGERPLRDNRLAYLGKERLEGRFTSPSWAIVVEAATGARYRANGQHSSTMLSRLPETDFPVGLMVSIAEYTTTDLNRDGFPIFNLFDNPRQARSNTDIMGLSRAQHADLADIDLSLLVELCNGVNHYEDHQPNGVTFPPRERGGHLEREAVRAFVLWAVEYETELHAWMFKKAGVVAEMYGNIQTDAPTAQEFWRLVLTESHPEADHDSRELSRILKDLLPTGRADQNRLQKEAAKYWRRYRRSQQPVAA